MKRSRTGRDGEIRIIGGFWRSRRLRFPGVDSLRPSPDAVRETLFNWLRNDISGARCLDLFAGSGAFGFEAASRGASFVTMVESNAEAARKLVQNADLLGANDVVRVVHGDVERFFHSATTPYDIIFMDPPFSSNLVDSTCRLLCRGELITGSTLLYIETPATKEQLPLPPTWDIIRQKDHGTVRSTLINLKPIVHDI